MNKWDKLLTERHRRYYDEQIHGVLHMNKGMAKSAIEPFRSLTGYAWCDEFFSLYARHDGIGIQGADNVTTWSFVPTTELIAFKQSVCGWFQDTHAVAAAKFFPFFDWGNGDAIGYIDLEGVETLLFIFDHESYEFDPDQEVTEFLKPSYESIADFLKV